MSSLSPIYSHENTPSVVTLSQSHLSWDGSIVKDYPTGQPEILVKKIVMPVGLTTPIHKHPNPMAVYVLKGESI